MRYACYLTSLMVSHAAVANAEKPRARCVAQPTKGKERRDRERGTRYLHTRTMTPFVGVCVCGLSGVILRVHHLCDVSVGRRGSLG